MKGKDFLQFQATSNARFNRKVSKKTRTEKTVERKKWNKNLSGAPNVASTLVNLIQQNGRYQYNIWIYRIRRDFDLKNKQKTTPSSRLKVTFGTTESLPLSSTSKLESGPSDCLIPSEVPVENPENVTEAIHKRSFSGVWVEAEN